MTSPFLRTPRFITRLVMSAGVTIAISGGMMLYVRSVGPIDAANLPLLVGVSAFATALAMKAGTKFWDRLGSSVIITTIAITLAITAPRLASSLSGFIDEITTDPVIPIALFGAIVVCVPVAAFCSLVLHRSALQRKPRGGTADR